MLFLSFFFFYYTATPDLYTFPYTTLFRSIYFNRSKLLVYMELFRFCSMLNIILYLLIYGIISGWRTQFVVPKLIERDRKSTRLNSSHANISYAVFCLKKKKIKWMPAKQ